MATKRGINNMNLCQNILKIIIKSEEPITTYRIAKELDEEYNSVKYNIQKLEEHKAILAVERKDKQNGTYYVPNKLFTEIDIAIEHLTPTIEEALKTVNMNKDNAKFNFRMLLSLIINEVVINGKKENYFQKTDKGEPRGNTARLTEA